MRQRYRASGESLTKRGEREGGKKKKTKKNPPGRLSSRLPQGSLQAPTGVVEPHGFTIRIELRHLQVNGRAVRRGQKAKTYREETFKLSEAG